MIPKDIHSTVISVELLMLSNGVEQEGQEASINPFHVGDPLVQHPIQGSLIFPFA
jgi:hypothetical protein